MDSLFSTADLVQAVVLGVALAMDAMAVTLSNSLCEPDMPASKKLAMPVMFALFQMAMPIAGFFGGTKARGGREKRTDPVQRHRRQRPLYGA